MKKVIIPFDGQRFSNAAFEFARQLNEMEPLLLVGVFLPEISYPGKYGFSGMGVMEMPMLLPYLKENIEEATEANIRHFRDLCVKNHVEFRVHVANDGFALPQLAKETCYADLVIIGSQLFYDDDPADREPGAYLTTMLHHTRCPVLLLPENAEFPRKVILAYDGSDASVFAIKQFAYLLPELCRLKTYLVYADGYRTDEIPDLPYIEELGARHYTNLHIQKLKADPHKYFETMLTEKKAPLLVTGAFQRSGLSRFFRKSFADEIIKDFVAPVFIAHH
jgi:nucleotide-binding universal stress UspA family protein